MMRPMARNALDQPDTGTDAARTDPSPAVPQRKFVRVIEQHPNGLVRFDFAVGWPDLSCELVLPHALFDDFCRRNAVEFMTEPAAPGINTLPSPEPSEP
jgi:hypothetical protein